MLHLCYPCLVQYLAMFSILINDNVFQQVSDKNVAYANYRAICRDFKNKSSDIKLLSDDVVLHNKPANLMLLDDIDATSANDILTMTMQRLNVDIKQLKKLLQDTDLMLSNSRIDGWIKPIHDRKFVKMNNDELLIVLDVMIKNNQAMIKSPENIVNLRKKLGLTQSELAEKFGLKSGFVQISRWESGKQEMPDSKWKEMLKMSEFF